MAKTRIYIVEDEATSARVISHQLTDLGYEVCGQAARGEVALEEIPVARPDVVVMDIQLSGGLDGLETTVRVRQRLDVPVVYLTASSDAKMVEQAIGTGSFGYLIKPIELRELHATIQAALYKHRVEQLLREDVRRQAEFLDALHQTTLDLLDRREMPDLLQAIVERAAALLAAPFGEMMLRENDEMVVVAFTGNQPFAKGSRLRREDAPLSWEAYDTSRPVVIENYSTRPDRGRIYDPQSLQAVAEFPILHRNSCLGVLSLGRTEPGRQFSPEEIQHGEILAKHAALVMHHASIYADAVRETEQRTAELRASEEKYRGLVTSMNDGVFVVDAQGRLTFANPALARLMGVERPEQVVGRSIFEFLAPATLNEISAYFRQAVETGRTREATIVQIVRGDGSSVVAEVKSNIVWEGNQVVGMKGMIRDITEPKRAEQALTAAHRRTTVLAQLGCELAEASTARIAALSILQAARQILDWDCSWLHLWDEKKQQFEDVANFDLVDGERREVPENPSAPREPSPMLRRVMEQGPQLLLRESETDQIEDLNLLYGTRRSLSLMLVPIRVPDRFIGILSIQSYQRQAYDPAALDLLQTMADHCAGALARIQATSALATSEERFRLVWENATDGMRLTDDQGRIVAANEAFCRMFGQTRKEVEGQLLSALYAEPENLEVLARHQDRFARHDILTRSERQLRLADGRIIWVEVSSCFIESYPVRPLLLGIFRDITERKLTEDALRLLSAGVANLAGEPFFKEVACQLSQLLGVEIGFIGKLLPTQAKVQSSESNLQRPVLGDSGHGTVGPRIRTLGLCIDGTLRPNLEYHLAGTPCEAVIGKQTAIYPERVAELFPSPRGIPGFVAGIPEAFVPRGEDQTLELRISGYAAIPLFDLAGHPIGHVGVMSRQPLHNPHRVEAILQLFAVRVAAEIERQRAERRFQDLFEFSPDAIVMINETGRIMMANQQAEKLFGYAHGELVGQPVENLLPAAKRQAHVTLRAGFQRAPVPRPMAAGQPDLRGLKKDGSEFPVDVSLNPLESDTGTWVAAAIRDLTELRRAQQQTLRAQRLESIGTLSGGIAHDLNNALAPILVATELLHERYPDSTELLDTMSSSAQRAANMVKQLLTFAKGVEGARLLIQPLHLLKEMEKIIKSTFPKNIGLRVQYGPNLQTVLGDATQLHQVLLNLCVNARDVMPEGGTLTLTAENAEIDAAYAGAFPEGRPGHYVVCRVTDTGPGIPPEIVERIFEPFFSTKGPTKGTGLGLSTATGIVKSHGGFIRVQSQPGQGATFAVYLPARETIAAPPAHGSESSQDQSPNT